MDIGPSEAETFWTAFLRKLARRGLRGVKLVVSDAHEGIKAAVSKVLTATWQRCRVHFMRNALAHAGKSGRRVVSAFIATAFAQDEGPFGQRSIQVDGQALPYFSQIFWAGLAGVAQLPSTVVPGGLAADGLPVGVQLIGPAYGDLRTVQLAQRLEALGFGFTPPAGY
jgi:Asp-tRNA(Asn)/Glu-tRNA(Gln) amidotransferase A subunit family amidase